MTSARVHWLTGTTDEPVGDVLDVVRRLTDGADFEVKAGRWMYGARFVTVEGIEVLTDPREPSTMPPVCVNVPGNGCDLLGAVGLRELAGLLRPTRVDFAWDDVPFAVSDVAEWVKAGHMRTRLRAATLHETVRGDGGDGVTLGTRNGTAQVVAYDRRGPVRLEFRLRGERAAACSELLAGDPAGWSSSFVELLRGVVDFVDRGEANRADRCNLLPSWESFISGAERVVVALTKAVAPTLERATRWFAHQVAKRAHMLQAAGVDLLGLVEGGSRRMGASDRIMLQGWRLGPPALTSTA